MDLGAQGAHTQILIHSLQHGRALWYYGWMGEGGLWAYAQVLSQFLYQGKVPGPSTRLMSGSSTPDVNPASVAQLSTTQGDG